MARKVAPGAVSSQAGAAKASSAPVRPEPTTRYAPGEASQVSASLQGGAALPPTLRERMEHSFGRSFSAVKVHTDATAARATDRHAADALTVGSRIAFAPGRYQPGTRSGDRLIAHELAHVAQQSSGGGIGAQAHSRVSTESEPAERAADHAADRAVRGESVGSIAGGLSLRGRLMRRARRGRSRLPALTLSPPIPGSRSAGGAAQAVPQPASTALLSPAGNRLPATVGAAPSRAVARRADGRASPGGPEQRAAPEIKGPDEAQTPIPSEPGPAPSAAVAGAPAGASPQDVAAGAGQAGEAGARGERAAEERKKKEGERFDEAEKDQKEKTEKQKQAAGAKAEKKKKRKFGDVPGDRGAAAAKQAAKRLDARGRAMGRAPPAGQRVREAQGAAAAPANEGESRAQGDQVCVVSAAEAPPADPASSRSEVKAAVEAAAPANMAEIQSMEGRTSSVSGVLAASVGGQVQGVQATVEAVNEPGAPQASEPAVPVPPPEAPAGTEAPNLAAATPPPVPGESLDATEFKEEAEGALAKHDVDDETLAKANEGPLANVAADKGSLDQSVEQAGSNVRGQEGPALAGANAGLANAEATSDGSMAAQREAGQAAVGTEQQATQGTKEQKDQTAADRIQEIYGRASQEVNGKLQTLTSKATDAFDKRQKELLKDFISNTKSDLLWFKVRRYIGPLGPVKFIKDRFVSINELTEVKNLYARNRNAYITQIDALIGEISADIDTTISDCKQTLLGAKTEIQQIIASAPAQQLADAQAAQQRVQGEMNRLVERVDRAAAEAKQALQQRREQAIKSVDDALAKIQAENEALVDKIKKAIQAIAEALGKFMRLMTRITRMGIGAFLASALSQAGEGIRSHLWGALQEAFKQWIFSKIPFLQPLMNLPPNWMEMLTALALNLPSLLMENLPALLPAIGAAAMTWLAINLAAKLIPGAGAIMAVIDGLRAAMGLVTSLLTAGAAFFAFAMKVAQPAAAAAAFARALAAGIIAGLEAVLTFLGVDRLIRRVGGAIARPFGRIFSRIAARFRNRRRRRRTERAQRRERERTERRREERDDPRARSERRRARDQGRQQRRADRMRRNRRRQQRHQKRRRQAPRRRTDRESRDDNRRRRRQERERRRRERLQRAITRIRPQLGRVLRDGVSPLRLRAHLLLWRIRYRLSSLRMLAGGQIEAAVNPRQVFDRAQRMSPAALGSLLRPILERAEDEYRRALMRDPRSRARVGHAGRRAQHEERTRRQLDSPSARPLSRGERVGAMRRPPRPGTQVDAEQGVIARQSPFSSTEGRPSGTLIGISGHGAATYPDLSTALVDLEIQGVMTSRSAFAFLAAPRSEQSRIGARFGIPPQVQTLLRGIATLDDLERARLGAEGTAMAVARRLGATGQASLAEQFGDPLRGGPAGEGLGELGPATMVGAQRGQLDERNRRIGNIFQRLEQAALRATILKEPGGAQLQSLARAVDRLLRARSDEAKKNASDTLVAELVALLVSFD